MKIILLYFLLLVTLSGRTQENTKHGRLIRYEDFQSRYIPPRNVDVWLPEGYTPTRKYNVLYMHDGQNVYDLKTSNFGGWKVDSVLTLLMAKEEIAPYIVVAIWNNPGNRVGEYIPQAIFEHLSDSFKRELKTLKGEVVSDNYLSFLVKELKPFIDKTYSTQKDRNSTSIMGSSMGGLISLYALTKYPKIFGSAACLSTHWPTLGKEKEFAVTLNYLHKNLSVGNKQKIYFDHGTQQIDKQYAYYQEKVDSLMQAKGFSFDQWTSKVFENAAHNETYWATRLHIPLKFILKNPAMDSSE